MNWTPYKHGQLAKCSHGYYFVFQRHHHEAGPDRWFIEYEQGADEFGDHGMLTGRPHGLTRSKKLRRTLRAMERLADLYPFCHKIGRHLEALS
jgi:hypothetical protein